MALDPPVLDGTDQVARGDTFLKLRWEEFPTAVSYSVHCGPHVQVFTIPDVPFATEFTGLPSNTPFALSLEVVLDPMNVLHSDEVTIFTRPRPPAFILLDDPAEAARQSDTLVLTWESVPDITQYEVERAGGPTLVAGIPGPSGFPFPGLQPNTLNTFVVRSRVTARDDVSFNSPAFTGLTRPPQPESLSVAPVPINGALLRWGGVPDFPGSGEALFELGRADGLGAEPIPLPGSAPLTAGSLVNRFGDGARDYSYGIRTVVGSNVSFWRQADFRPRLVSAITRGDVLISTVRRERGFREDLARFYNGT